MRVHARIVRPINGHVKGHCEVSEEHVSKLRTGNVLGALATEIAARLERHGRQHPNETSSAAAALNVIGFCEGCFNSTLSYAFGLSHSATVRLVDKLEEADLVRSEAGTDKRFVALRLTEAGRTHAREAARQRCELLSDIIDILTPGQYQQLDAIAETLLRSLVLAATDADHICRLCDTQACPPMKCPVRQKALALETAYPRSGP